MIRTLLLLSLVALSACAPQDTGKPPPIDQLYFPAGLTFVPADGGRDGVLYVASANSDKRFDFGTVTALDLSQVALPPFGAEVAESGPVQFPDLPIAADGVVFIQSFAGEMASFPLPGGGVRLFVPSRAEGSPLQIIDADGPALKCFNAPEGENHCQDTAPSLVALENTKSGVPRASSPFGVGISPEGTVFVTELDGIDSPKGSQTNFRAYLVAVNALDPAVDDKNFLEVNGPTNSVAVGSRYAFLTGRANGRFDPYRVLTLVDRTVLNSASPLVLQPALEQTFKVLDARGLALSKDETRLYIAARFPDTLLVVDVAGASTPDPLLRVVFGVPLPAFPNDVKILSRPGRGDLVAVTCSVPANSESPQVVLYDTELGMDGLVAQIPGVGDQPFAMAVEPVGAGARLFVSNFSDGRIAVIDIVNLSQPSAARVVAHLGRPQTCITTPKDVSCQSGVTQ